MSHNARVEEITSDNEMDSDPSEMDPTDFDPDMTIMRASDIPSSSKARDTSAAAPPPQHQTQLPIRRGPTAEQRARERERTKSYQCLYPIYFDKSRSRNKGRRVSSALAVENPLAYSIVQAVHSLGVQNSDIAFEPAKTHPNDWANPGRVRVNLKNTTLQNSKGHGKEKKRYLYTLVAKWLKDHPTTKATQLECQMRDLPVPEEKYRTPAIPKGQKMGTILPLHSPALSGGGVNENFLKDMMQGMGGMQGGGGGMPGGMGGMQLPPGMMEMMNGMGGMGGGGSAAPPSQRAVSGTKKDKKGKK